MLVGFELGLIVDFGLVLRWFVPETLELRYERFKITITISNSFKPFNFMFEQNSDNVDEFLGQSNTNIILDVSYQTVEFMIFFQILQQKFFNLSSQEPIMIYQLLEVIIRLLLQLGERSLPEEGAIFDGGDLEIVEARFEVGGERTSQEGAVGGVEVAVDAQVEGRGELFLMFFGGVHGS